MIKYKDQRVGVFVDVANMYHSAKNLYNDARVNFKEILKDAVDGRQLIRAIAYVVQSKSAEEEPFFDALTKQGFEVKMKDLQIFVGGAKKADWDVGLAIDTIKLADRLDAIILVSGDGDYIPLVKYLQENKGCQVEVMAFGQTTSGKLIEAADDFTDLSKDGKYLIQRIQDRFRKRRR
ncbi:MAG: NYN domain-containing protein [bacterium]